MIHLKKIIPPPLKSVVWQFFLHLKHRRNNSIGKKVIISKDFICGKDCRIGDCVILGREVVIGNNVKIGRNAVIEKVQISDNSCVEGRVVFTGHGKGRIKIGKESYIGIYNVLDWSNDIYIGDYVHIAGPSTGIWTHTSAKSCVRSNIPLSNQSEDVRPTAPVHIENNIWIGGNCTIYPGVRIGHHSIVAPNSAVYENVEPFSMVGGVPAKLINKIEMPNDFKIKKYDEKK